MIHETSDVKSINIGSNTNIWQYCVVFEGAIIGDNCNVCSHVLIESGAIIGNNVTIKSGVQIWDGVSIQDNVFVGPNVTFTNDVFPRSKSYPSHYAKTLIKKGASIGANCTIIAGISIGEAAMIGAGSLVTKTIGDRELWYGSPAKFISNLCHCGSKCGSDLKCKKCIEK